MAYTRLSFRFTSEELAILVRSATDVLRNTGCPRNWRHVSRGTSNTDDRSAANLQSAARQVTYTYKVVDTASWAQRPDVQQAFSDTRTTVNGALKTTEVAGLQLSSKGWKVPGQ